ncbi:MAG: transporter associated domain-containing protein [Pseudomonadota bacterium]|nr:transporter associated domain-containing protein [Pseudomonadota bacterium]
MNDEPPSTGAPAPRSWLNRLGHMISGEARNRVELLEELRTAHANGLISADTLAMVEGAIGVSDKQVSDVMVPRAQMVTLPVDADVQIIIEIVIESGHSRFPVTGEDRDEVIGILLAKDLLRCLADASLPCNIRELIRPVSLIPESKRLNLLLKEFRTRRNHMAVVVDEYGGVAGLVTIEDVLELIVGEIDDEHDDEANPDEHIRAAAEGRFAVDAITPIGKFNERFGSKCSDEEYDTIGGMVTEALGHLPQPGEEVEIEGFHFLVTKADARRVHQFLVRQPTEN